MPKAVMKDEDEYPLPAGVPFPAVLVSVEEQTIEYTRKKDGNGKKAGEKDSFVKWRWTFEITEGQYQGEKAYGDTEDRLTNREDNLVRQWAEALLKVKIEVGQGLDTDTLIGLPCLIDVRHDEPREKRTGGNFYPCPVDNVYEATATDYPQW